MDTTKQKEKEIILKTIRETVHLMKNPCSFRKFLQNLGLESIDYEDLYIAGGMYLTNLALDIKEYEDKVND